MVTQKKIKQPYNHFFEISKSGLVAIFISANCKSKSQLNGKKDEDLRFEIDGLRLREIPPLKNIQLFNIPASWNGSKLKGLKKTIVLLIVLQKGKHVLSLISRDTAFVNDIGIRELSGIQDVKFDIEEQAEDGDRRPWYTFALVDLPLKTLTVKVATRYRWADSDDVKVIIDNHVQKQLKFIFFRFWFFTGFLFKRIFKKETVQEYTFKPNLSQGLHYIEFWADKTPVLHRIELSLKEVETKAEIRANNIIRDNTVLIVEAAKEFEVDPIIVGSVIYQEQSQNVNFIDTLTDYIGGLLHLNTSIGVGQIRVKTAKLLENYYPDLDSYRLDSLFIDYNIVRATRLKDPFINIRYVAAKINFSQRRWKEADFDIKNHPEILGTLYNIEDIENPIDPHAEPRANKFGEGVKKNYTKVKKLLGL